MRLKNGTADRESHSGPVIFRGEEGVEYLIRLVLGQSRSGIADGNQQAIVLLLRLEVEFSFAVRVLHRVNGIHH